MKNGKRCGSVVEVPWVLCPVLWVGAESRSSHLVFLWIDTVTPDHKDNVKMSLLLYIRQVGEIRGHMGLPKFYKTILISLAQDPSRQKVWLKEEADETSEIPATGMGPRWCLAVEESPLGVYSTGSGKGLSLKPCLDPFSYLSEILTSALNFPVLPPPDCSTTPHFRLRRDPLEATRLGHSCASLAKPCEALWVSSLVLFLQSSLSHAMGQTDGCRDTQD